MLGLSAIVFVPDDTGKTGLASPLMLHNVSGAPLLAWLADALYDRGVDRFFLVCHDRYLQAARECLPAQAEILSAADSNAADLLHVFLSTAEDAEQEITIVAGPAVFAPGLAGLESAGKRSGIFRVSRQKLMDALDESFSLGRFLADHGTTLTDADGCFAVASPEAALLLVQKLRQDKLLRLAARGVEVYDLSVCVLPGVTVERGAVLLPGTILRGRTIVRSGAVIGPNSLVEDAVIGPRARVNASQVYGSNLAAEAAVGPFAHVRPDCEIGRGVKLGNFVEVKNATIGDGTWVSHLSYVGDADLGQRCNLGCGTVTVNFDRVEKHRTTIADDVFVGCNSALVAPVTLGPGAYIAAGSTITEDVPPSALGIARARQSNKRDWAAKHKK